MDGGDPTEVGVGRGAARLGAAASAADALAEINASRRESPNSFPLAIFPFPDTRTGFQLLHGTKVPSMSDWQNQTAGLVQNVARTRTSIHSSHEYAHRTP